jgi:hypothetical protein
LDRRAIHDYVTGLRWLRDPTEAFGKAAPSINRFSEDRRSRLVPERLPFIAHAAKQA